MPYLVREDGEGEAGADGRPDEAVAAAAMATNEDEAGRRTGGSLSTTDLRRFAEIRSAMDYAMRAERATEEDGDEIEIRPTMGVLAGVVRRHMDAGIDRRQALRTMANKVTGGGGGG